MEPFENFINNLYQNRNRNKYPFYSDEADYNTNAPSYYDDLARKTELIKILAHRIWEYDEELRKRFEQWDNLMKAFPEIAKELFREWLRNGTIEAIIRDELEDFKDEVRELIDDIDDFVNGFEIKDMEPKFVGGFGGIRNAVNQSINIDRENNQMYSTQSDSQNPEGFWINKLTPSGEFISGMRIVGGGHGTTIGLDRQSNGTMKIWFTHEQLNKLVQVTYQDNKVLSLEEAKELTDFTPQSVKDNIPQGYTPTLDEQNDKIALRFGGGRVQIYDRKDIINHVDNLEHELWIDELETGNIRWPQGFAVDGDDLYWLSGNSGLDSPIKIQKYSVSTGEKKYDYVFKLSYKYGVDMPRDDFKEPEGIYLYVNPKTKRKSLLLAMTNGGGYKRFNTLYGFFQANEYEHFNALMMRGGQNYKLTRDDGRALSIPDGTESLDELTIPGHFYVGSIRMAQLKKTPDYPMDAGYFIDVTPITQNFAGQQILTRLSLGRKIMKFTRSFAFDVGHTNDTVPKYSFGEWSVIATDSYEQEYINASTFDNNLKNLIMPGEYYLTSAQTEAFTDYPAGIRGTGAWLRVSSGNAGGQVRQEITTNSSAYLGKSYRNVNHKDKTALFDWITYYPIPK